MLTSSCRGMLSSLTGSFGVEKTVGSSTKIVLLQVEHFQLEDLAFSHAILLFQGSQQE